MRRLVKWMVFLGAVFTSGRPVRERENEDDTAAIQALFQKGAGAWNRGDLEGYLQTYADDERVKWISGGQMIIGKEAIRQAVTSRFSSGGAMGTLSITDLQVEIQTGANALVFARWHLTREGVIAFGVFTAHLKKIAGRWGIVTDHASVLAEPAGEAD